MWCLSTWVNTCKLPPGLCLGHMLWLTKHNSELMLQPPILCPLPLPWLLVCLVLITTSWISFADISTPLPLNPCAPLILLLPLSLSLPLFLFLSPNCQLCFTNRAVILSLRGTPLPLPSPAVRLDLPWQWAYLVHRWTHTSNTQTNKLSATCKSTCINVNTVQRIRVDVAHARAPFDLTLAWHKTPPSHPHA